MQYGKFSLFEIEKDVVNKWVKRGKWKNSVCSKTRAPKVDGRKRDWNSCQGDDKTNVEKSEGLPLESNRMLQEMNEKGEKEQGRESKKFTRYQKKNGVVREKSRRCGGKKHRSSNKLDDSGEQNSNA